MADHHSLEFFDCNCAVGPYRTQVFRFAKSAGELLEEMDFANVDRALVYHTAMRFDHPANGNRRVLEETKGQTRLVPTWSILPSQTGEQPAVEIFLKEMRQNGVRALRMYPDDHRYFVDEMTWGDQLSAYAEQRIPIFLRANLDKVAQIVGAFPDLIVVTGAQGSNPLDRYAWPLADRFPNLLFETSAYLVDGGIEEFCKRYSAERLLFGSGYPDNSNGAAMLMLAQAELSPSEKRAIASGNLERLLAGAFVE